jgi:nucleotide-binding universal stress UspA family protein
MTRPSVLCPVDFSNASRGALRYAAALAEHFYGDLIVLTVNAPVTNDVAAFVDSALGRRPQVAQLRLEIANGLPPTEILRVANESHADVIVMSTHGTTGARTMLGSVTERVLHDTKVPVVVTPADDPGPRTLEEWKLTLRRILVPVDLTDWTPLQISVARGLSDALGAELLFLHVLDKTSGEDRLAAHQQLNAMIHSAPVAARPGMALATGEPAREIARVARERGIDLIVLGLHSSTDARRGMGHVTYAVLCQTPTLVLAWPPSAASHQLPVAS